MKTFLFTVPAEKLNFFIIKVIIYSISIAIAGYFLVLSVLYLVRVNHQRLPRLSADWDRAESVHFWHLSHAEVSVHSISLTSSSLLSIASSPPAF